MKKSRTVRIVLCIVIGVLLARIAMSFCAVGLFYRFFYARYDTLCPTDLKVSDLSEPAVPVAFDAGDSTLSGYLIGDGQNGVIVIAHGMRSGMDAHFAEADYFAAHGYTVLVFDGTGTRTSGGDSRRSVSYARDDLDAALDWLETGEYGDLPVFLYGHSSGGYAAATALARSDAAVAVCAFDDPVDTMCDTARQYVGFLVLPQRLFLSVWNRIRAGSDANELASDCINATDVPILIVSASADTVIPDSDSLYLRAGAIDDPNAAYLLREGDHSDVWLSPDALAYRTEMQNAAPEAVDRGRYNAVDPAFLDEVLAFFASAQ
ncbi:MAG: alpha/beta fold hydrolase [Clostridia bacterium]|nr:alpha/beta fold hydrolase [Clostridia bacterium]